MYAFPLSLTTFIETNPLTGLLVEECNIFEGGDHDFFIFTIPTIFPLSLTFHEYLKKHLSYSDNEEVKSIIRFEKVLFVQKSDLGWGSTCRNY